jgi:YbbR domain-containing protein
VRIVKPLSHIGLRMLSLGLAVLLWLIVAGEEVVERSLRVPLELQQFPADLELRGDALTFVDVRVRGASTALSRMSSGDAIAMIDLHTARPGARLFQLTPEQVRTPFGVQVVQVTPASVALTFENSKTRMIPVSPSWEGSPSPGFAVGRVTATPTMVQVVGPESSVDRVTEAVTEAVSVAGRRQTVTENVTVGFVDPALRVNNPRPATVSVQVEIISDKN